MIRSSYPSLVLTRKQCLFFGISLLLSLSLFFGLSFKIGTSLQLPYASFKSILAEAMPIANTSEAKTSRILLRNQFVHFITGFDFRTKGTYLASTGGIFSAIVPQSVSNEDNQKQNLLFDFSTKETPKAQNTTPTTQSTASIQGNHKIINLTSLTGSKNYYIPQPGIAMKNDTTFTIDGGSMLKEPIKINMKTGGPKILIMHTHTTESYLPDGVTGFNDSYNGRSNDTKANVVAVGEKMCEVFRKNGIEVIHDTTVHDQPSFNSSYNRAMKTINADLAKYPTVEMVIDVHRDAAITANKSAIKYTTQINGQSAAQVMLVMGSPQGGLPHPHWEDNLKLAFKIEQKMNEEYPSLARPINLRKQRFNEHATIGSMILEVGTHVNSLSEAINGGSAAAQSISDVLNGLK